jgi:mRNA-degrading endonuclease toxin of MazEF toxin-antitoxin module
MERGDIYLVSLDPTSGHEQRGTRPVLVVSGSAFNRLTKTLVVLQMLAFFAGPQQVAEIVNLQKIQVVP